MITVISLYDVVPAVAEIETVSKLEILHVEAS